MGDVPGRSIFIFRGWNSKPDAEFQPADHPSCRQAGRPAIGETPNITINLVTLFFFLGLLVGLFVGEKRHKNSSSGIGFRTCLIRGVFSKNHPGDSGRFLIKRSEFTQNASTRCPIDQLHRACAIMPEALNIQ